ncbi:MAG: hypothetical protein AB7O31_13490 [Burkholderiales bacterium]
MSGALVDLAARRQARLRARIALAEFAADSLSASAADLRAIAKNDGIDADESTTACTLADRFDAESARILAKCRAGLEAAEAALAGLVESSARE